MRQLKKKISTMKRSSTRSPSNLRKSKLNTRNLQFKLRSPSLLTQAPIMRRFKPEKWRFKQSQLHSEMSLQSVLRSSAKLWALRRTKRPKLWPDIARYKLIWKKRCRQEKPKYRLSLKKRNHRGHLWWLKLSSLIPIVPRSLWIKSKKSYHSEFSRAKTQSWPIRVRSTNF